MSLMRALVSAWCLPLLALLASTGPLVDSDASSSAAITFADASYFVSPIGVEIGLPMRLPHIPDLTAALASLRAIQKAQSLLIAEQEAWLEQLLQIDSDLHANFDNTYAHVQQQLVEAESQRAMQVQQAAELSFLQSYDDANTANVSRIDSAAILLADRTAAVEAATTQMTADLKELNASFAQANHTATDVQSPLLSGLFLITSSQTAGIASLQVADEIIAANLTEIAADAAALRARVTQNELAAIALTNQQSDAESTITVVTSRTEAIEAALVTIAAVEANHTASIAELNALTTIHTAQLAPILVDDAALQSNMSVLLLDDASHTARTKAVQAAASLLLSRVVNAEDLEPTTSVLVDTVLAIWPRVDSLIELTETTLTSVATMNTTVLGLAAAEEANATALTIELTIAEQTTQALYESTVASLANISSPLDTYTQKMIGLKSPRLHRYTFLTSQQWTVPDGVTSAMVTMAGGGGSGYGWRIVNGMSSGPSGGYVWSSPIQLTPGEVLNITVGTAGAAYQPIATEFVTGYKYLYTNPTDDDGFSGYAVVSVGASTTALVAGNMRGAMMGDSTTVGTIAVTNRPATGPYATSGRAGACGANQYGLGNDGFMTYPSSSGRYAGGTTPFGYGSGSLVDRSGCLVTTTVTGTCTSQRTSRNGVVFIDVMY